MSENVQKLSKKLVETKRSLVITAIIGIVSLALNAYLLLTVHQLNESVAFWQGMTFQSQEAASLAEQAAINTIREFGSTAQNEYLDGALATLEAKYSSTP